MKKNLFIFMLIMVMTFSFCFADATKNVESQIKWLDGKYEVLDFMKGSDSLFGYVNSNFQIGVLDSSGKSVINPFGYNSIKLSGENLIVEKKNYFYNPDEKLSPKNVQALYSLSGKRLTSFDYEALGKTSEGITAFREGGIWGYYNSDGVIVKPKFAGAEEFKNSLAVVEYNNNGKRLYGAVNKNGDVVIPMMYDVLSNSGGTMLVASKGLKFGYLNSNGKVEIPLTYDFANDFNNGLAIVGMRTGSYFKYGMINEKNEVVIPIKYNVLFNYDGEYAIFGTKSSEKTLYGLIDKGGKEVVTAIYDDLGSVREGLLSAKKSGKYGFINVSGAVVIPFEYEACYRFQSGYAAVKQNGKWGYINKSGKVVEPIKYDEAYSFENGAAIVRENKLFHLIDTNFKTITDDNYNDIVSSDYKLYNIYRLGKIGLVDNTGKTILAPKFDYVNYSEKYILVKKDGKFGIVSNPMYEVNNVKN